MNTPYKLSWTDINNLVAKLVSQIAATYMPDVIVILAHRNLTPVTQIGRLLNISDIKIIKVDSIPRNATDNVTKLPMDSNTLQSLSQKHVLIVENNVSEGQSLGILKQSVKQIQPASVYTATLVVNTEDLQSQPSVDFIGMRIQGDIVFPWELSVNPVPSSPALISLSQSLPSSKVWNIVHRIANEYSRRPNFKAIFVCGFTQPDFQWSSRDIDLYVTLENWNETVLGTHELYDGTALQLDEVPTWLLTDTSNREIHHKTALAFSQFVTGDYEVELQHRQFLQNFHKPVWRQQRARYCLENGKEMFSNLTSASLSLTEREWRMTKLFQQAIGPAICHLNGSNITNRKLLIAVMPMCLQTYRIEWINACLTLVGLRTVSNDVVQRLLKLVREYLQENQRNLYLWEWPNYLTTELYYGAATELANEGHYVPSVLCLRMVTAEVQSRSDMPLSNEIQNLLHGNVKWDERIIAADFLLKEIERAASEL